jgi:hypothetical protein
MSLISQALIIATANVLRGKTWAGDLVFRQPIDPISEVLRTEGETQRPVIAVYVDSAKFTGDGRQTQGSQSAIELKIFVYVAPGRLFLPEETHFVLDSNSAGLTLDVMVRQVDAAFHADQGYDLTVVDWLSVWKKLAWKVGDRNVRYVLIEVENGIKIPTVEITYSLSAIPDPNFVGPMTAAWEMFDERLRADGGEGVQMADLFKGMIDPGASIPDYIAFMRNFGLTPEGLAGTGIGPAVPGAVLQPNGTIPELERIDHEGSAAIVTPEDGA